MSSLLVRLATAIAILCVLMVHSVDARLGCFMEDEHQQQQQQQQPHVEERTSTQTAETEEWPSLRLDIAVKREDMKVHGKSNFSIVANPRTDYVVPEILYDAFTSFSENGEVRNFTLVDGTPYVSSGNGNDAPTVKCLGDNDANVLLMVNTIAQMINTADKVDASKTECTTGNAFEVTLAGTVFNVCGSTAGFSMQGTDMDVSVEFLSEPNDIAIPTGVDGCERLNSATPITSTGQAILTGRY